VLLVTGWTDVFRDVAYRLARQHYVAALFFYVLLLSLLAKLLGLGLDYYAYRLEHRFHLSNQGLISWIKDQIKGWLVGLMIGTLLVELAYLLIRKSPEHWWLIAWVVFIALFIFFAQIAPVTLFPLFYKFKPLEDEELKQRLLRLSERAGTQVHGVYEGSSRKKARRRMPPWLAWAVLAALSWRTRYWKNIRMTRLSPSWRTSLAITSGDTF